MSYTITNLYLYNPYIDEYEAYYSNDYCFVDYSITMNNKTLNGTYDISELSYPSINTEQYIKTYLEQYLDELLNKPTIESQGKLLRYCFYSLISSSNGIFFYETNDFISDNYSLEDISLFIENTKNIDAIEYDFTSNITLTITCYGNLMTLFHYSTNLS